MTLETRRVCGDQIWRHIHRTFKHDVTSAVRSNMTSRPPNIQTWRHIRRTFKHDVTSAVRTVDAADSARRTPPAARLAARTTAHGARRRYESLAPTRPSLARVHHAAAREVAADSRADALSSTASAARRALQAEHWRSGKQAESILFVFKTYFYRVVHSVEIMHCFFQCSPVTIKINKTK